MLNFPGFRRCCAKRQQPRLKLSYLSLRSGRVYLIGNGSSGSILVPNLRLFFMHDESGGFTHRTIVRFPSMKVQSWIFHDLQTLFQYHQ